MRSDPSDVEVVFDLPAEELGAGYLVDGQEVDQELDPEVRRMREELVRASRDRDHGSAAEALTLLEAHRTAPEEALLSVLLVCTHRRFARCSRTLMRRLESDGVLMEVELDVLAALLVWEDRARFAIPSTWLSTRLDVAPGVLVRAQGFEVVPPGEDEQTFPYVCNIPAAARRWAVRRLIEHGQTDVDAVLARIDELRDGAGGAVLSGVLDAWAVCPPEDLQCAVDTALDSSLASVRLRALDVLALTGRLDQAVARARGDGAAAVRAWQPPAAADARIPAQLTLLDHEG